MSLPTLEANQVPVEKSYFTFVAGLNTDASPLNFPENFSSDEENFILNLDGSRNRRKGLALETDGSDISVSILTTVFSDTPTVVDNGDGTRGFQITIQGLLYTFIYDSTAQTLVMWAILPGINPFVSVTINAVTFTLANAVMTTGTYYNKSPGASREWTWSNVATFPAISATPTTTVNGSSIPSSGIVRTHHWRNVNGNPALNFLVLQIGHMIYIYTDSDVISDDTERYSFSLASDGYRAADATDDEIALSPINTDYGRGHCFIVGKHIHPLYLEWDEINDVLTVTPITIYERDFEGIDDGIDNMTQPETTPSVASHEYNLKNKGWTSVLINTFKSDRGLYPSKNMIAHRGYARVNPGDNTTTTAEADWTKAFSPDKLVGELWQDVPAPSGHFIRNPFNTLVVGSGETGESFNIETWTISADAPGTQTVTVETSGDHGLADSDVVTIYAQNSTYITDEPHPYKPINLTSSWSFAGDYPDININVRTITAATNANPAVFTCNGHGLFVGNRVTLALVGNSWPNVNGTYEITSKTLDTFTISSINGTTLGTFFNGTATPTDTFEITVYVPDDFTDWSSQYRTLGTVRTNNVNNASGYSTDYRPTAVAFFAGRVWYAGTESAHLSHKVFFSQIVESDGQYGKCYQVADPTSEHISDLVASDGGVISIPEVDNIKELIAYNGRLLVFADNGVWEIAGGADGYFKATDYSVRQIANVGAVNAASIIIAEGTPFFWGEGAIYNIQQDPDKGFLFVQDISTGKIQKLVLGLSKGAKAQVQAAYDRSSKKVYWLYDADSGSTWKYNTWLVMDLRLGMSFSKFRNYGTTHELRAIYDIEDYQSEEQDYRNVKFFGFNLNRTSMRISELNDITFEDYGVDAAAFVETGWGALGPPDRRKYGRYLFTFMKRTETGYNNVDEDWIPTDPSKCKVRYIWNWADTSNTGKWSNQQGAYNQQAYKYRRPWIPSTSTDLMGEAVVVSKLKVRGSGKVLMLRYDTEAGYNCHLYGWHIRQDVNREA